MSLGMGGNVRVGLEDNFYLPSGAMVKSNGDLVAHAADMARAAGRSPATVDEARRMLGIDEQASRDTVSMKTVDA